MVAFQLRAQDVILLAVVNTSSEAIQLWSLHSQLPAEELLSCGVLKYWKETVNVCLDEVYFINKLLQDLPHI